MPPYTRALRVRTKCTCSIGHTHTYTKYLTLNGGWLRFEPVISCHIGSDTMLKTNSTKSLNL